MAKSVFGVFVVLLFLAPFIVPGDYFLHLVIMGLLWSYVYTSWSIMGRLGLVSFGHGAFLGIGAYSVVMLWNLFGLSPILGVVVGVALSLAVAFLIGYPCFRFKIVGHYFALVTLALTEMTRLIIVGMRDYTGGSLGITPAPALVDGTTASVAAMQFSDKTVWLYTMLLFWLAGLVIWRAVDRSMARRALQAISEDEDAAASIGIDVTATKVRITLLSAGMTAVGGALYAQYQQYIAPETVSGIAISLQIVFGVIAGGMFVALGPTVGAMLLLALSETLRILIGNEALGVDITIYGLMLILFIIFMPKGIVGTLLEPRAKSPSPAGVAPAAAGKGAAGSANASSVP